MIVSWWLIICILIVFAWVAITWPQRALMLLAVSLPLYVLRFELVGIPGTLLEGLIMVMALAWVTLAVRYGRPILPPSAWERRWLWWWLIAGSLAVIVTPDLRAGLGLWKAYIIEPVIVYCMLRSMARTPFDWQQIFIGLAVSGGVIALIAISQYITGWHIPVPWQDYPDRRATALYGYPNAIGLYLAPLTILVCGVAVFGNQLSRVQRAGFIGLALLMTIAILAARADGAVVAIVVGLFVLLQPTRLRQLAYATAGLGFIAALWLPATRAILFFQDTSGDVRLALWQGTISLLTHQPLTGAGLAGFPLTYDLYRLPSHVELLLYPHNLWLDVWVQLGLAGLLWLITTACALAILAVRSLHRQFTPELWILIAVWFGQLVYGLVDVVYFKNDLSVLWWILSAATVYYLSTKNIQGTRQNDADQL